MDVSLSEDTCVLGNTFDEEKSVQHIAYTHGLTSFIVDQEVMDRKQCKVDRRTQELYVQFFVLMEYVVPLP